jgi:hypothetical protein
VLALDYPRAPGFSLDKYFPQVSIDPLRLWFLPWTLEEPTPGKVDIVVYSELYNCFEEQRQYKMAVYRILYNILGERSFALDLGRVDLGNVSEVRRRKKLKPLEELPGYIGGTVSCGLMVGPSGELKKVK